MPAKITIQISERNFEIIRDRIGEILVTELAAQTVAAGVSVWKERFISFNQDELPAVNVSYNSSGFDNMNPKTSRGSNEFFIDVHTQSAHTLTKPGDEKAANEAVRLAGIVWYILSSQEYRTLDFDPGLIQHRSVSDINIGRLTNNQDASHTITARIILKVVANEEVGQIQPISEAIYSAQVKLDETERGYLWTIEN